VIKIKIFYVTIARNRNMANTKYGKYIIEDYNGLPASDYQNQDEFGKEMPNFAFPIAYLGNAMFKPGFHAECMWYHAASDARVEAHTHDSNEVLGFIGGDPNDYHNLNGVIELWLDDEKYILTRSCMVFVPKGLKHGPMIIIRVDKPMLHFSIEPI
jgi:hypothetical protein